MQFSSLLSLCFLRHFLPLLPNYINFINYSDNNPPNTTEDDYNEWLDTVDNKANLASKNDSNIGVRKDNIPNGSIWMGLDTDFKFDQNVWLQDENCVNAQIVDTKFIGKFKTVAKKSTNWRHRITQDTPEYVFEYLKYHGKQGKEYGVHIEDSETFCIHIGETWLNRSGRVTDKWISNSV